MKARVKANSSVPVVIAFTGLTFDRNNWKDVPPGCEAEALRHPYLEVDYSPEEPDNATYVPSTKLVELVSDEPEAVPSELEFIPPVEPEPTEIEPVVDVAEPPSLPAEAPVDKRRKRAQ
jgi:hypothetical protein